MELTYQIALTQLPMIGDVKAKRLVAACGSATAVFTEKKSTLLRIPDIGSTTVNSIINNKKEALLIAENELIFIEKHKITPVFYTNTSYPARLKYCTDGPAMLYYKGNTDLNPAKIISIVGTRNATDYGKELCKQLISDLQQLNITIVSGLAYGIDAYAHKFALENKLPTIGVLAHGLDRIYPATHKNLATEMLHQGGLLTEYISGTIPDRENFPSRNRIVAGMTDATIVIESTIKGGALITAEIANSYNKDVFAYPGRIHDTYSNGCNFLIKTNKAHLIENAKDLIYIMGWAPIKKKQNIQIQLFTELSEEEQKITTILKQNGDTSIDYLCHLSSIATSKIAVILLNLELQNIILALPGKQYRLNPVYAS